MTHRGGITTVENFTRISRSLIERSMALRCHAYLSNAKHLLLLKTIMELDRTKRHLLTSNQQLRELDKIKTLFIAGLTHELNNPLSSIIGYTELIMQGAGGPLTEKQQRYLHNVSASATHLKEIVADALDITKIESNALESHCSSFSLQHVVNEAVTQLTQKAAQKGIELSSKLESDITLYTDRRRLLQCLINLLSNAIKYTHIGQVILTATMRGRKVEITVSDTGVGLSADDLQHLFVAFKRGASARRTKEFGSGIGLYITNKLVQNILLGTITVTSEVDKGSTFTITIPVSLE